MLLVLVFNITSCYLSQKKLRETKAFIIQFESKVIVSTFVK